MNPLMPRRMYKHADERMSDEMRRRPPMSSPMSTAAWVVTGIRAVRTPCLTVTVRSLIPLERAVRM